jgi:hypothetical protein
VTIVAAADRAQARRARCDDPIMAPSVRARHPQMLLALVRERHADRHAPLTASLRHHATIEARLPVEWIPIEADVELIEALGRLLAPAPVAALVEERQRREMGSALFKSFVATLGTLFGLTPATMARQIPKGWGQVFQDCGCVQVRALAERGAELAVVGLPAVCLDSAAWLDAIPVGMTMLYELVGARGTVTRAPVGADGAVTLRFAW